MTSQHNMPVTYLERLRTELMNMKTFLRTCIAISMTCLSMSAIANPCDGGIGGTGIMLESGGIGGTGINNESGGIGGTGIISNTQQGIGGTGAQAESGIGGTGIVGVITGFGSVCVNGLEIHYFSDTPVDLDGKKISSQELSIGHVVSIRASGKDQSLVANEIHAYHQVSGPITAINAAGKKLKVMGQVVSANAAQLKGAQIGQWVNVSGLRKADGSVVASRIDAAKGQMIAQTVGNLSHQNGKAYLAGTKIVGLTETTGNINSDTRLTGIWDGNALHVKEVKLGPVSELLQKVEAFHLQGLASGNIANGHLQLSGQQIKVTGGTKISSNSANAGLSGKAIIMRGQVKDGKPTAQSIDLQPIKTELKMQHDPTPTQVRPKISGESAEKRSATSGRNQKQMVVDTKVTADKVKRDEKVDKSESLEKSKKVEKAEKVERAEKIERTEKLEHVEKIERVEKVELPEKIERVEKVERVELPEKIEKTDRVERAERTERPERTERAERHD